MKIHKIFEQSKIMDDEIARSEEFLKNERMAKSSNEFS